MTSQSLCNVLETRKRSGNAGFLGFAQIAQGGRLPIIHLKLPKLNSRALPFFEPRFDQLESFIKSLQNFRQNLLIANGWDRLEAFLDDKETQGSGRHLV